MNLTASKKVAAGVGSHSWEYLTGDDNSVLLYPDTTMQFYKVLVTGKPVKIILTAEKQFYHKVHLLVVV